MVGEEKGGDVVVWEEFPVGSADMTGVEYHKW